MGLFDFFKQNKYNDRTSYFKQDSAKTSSTNTKDRIKTLERTSFQVNPSLLKLYKVYRMDSLVKQTVSLYTELQLQNNFKIKSTDPKINKKLQQRLREIEYNSNQSVYEIIRNAFKHYVAFGNAMYIFTRNQEKTSGKSYKYDRQTLKPISGIFVQHPLTISIERNQYGTVSSYKQDLSLIMSEYNFFVGNPELNATYNYSSPLVRKFDKFSVGHIKYDYDILTGFGRPFYFEVIDDIVMMRKLEMIMEELVSSGKLSVTVYNIGNNNYPIRSQQEIIDGVELLEKTDPYGIIVAPHNHSVTMTSNNVLMQILEFYDRVRHRVYGQLGISSVLMGEAGQANRATAEVSANSAFIKTREIQKLFAQQFQHEVLEHIVLDLGYNPKELGEAMPRLEFNDPDIDYMIKLRTHSVYLYEHSVITQSEVRNALGLNPDIDQSDMYIYRVKLPVSGLSADIDKGAETENLINPQNQHSGQVN